MKGERGSLQGQSMCEEAERREDDILRVQREFGSLTENRRPEYNGPASYMYIVYTDLNLGEIWKFFTNFCLRIESRRR